MDPILVGAVGMGALFALIVLKVPIGIAMMLVGVCGFGLQAGWGPAFSIVVGDPSQYLQSVDLATVPLFLLMGTFAGAAGFSSDIYAIATAFLGHRRGGLSYATVGGCAAFGTVCGSSTATAATFGKIALPQMLSHGYEPGFAAASVAAGGALKSLIPPSLVMILYSVVTNVFIFDLFTAAIVPAILVVVLNILAIYAMTKIAPQAVPTTQRALWAERLRVLKVGAPAFFLIAAVFGGLYSGVFTVNEAACVAAILSVLFAYFRRRLTWSVWVKSFLEAAGITAMLYIIIFGAAIFTYFITLAKVPEALIQMVAELNVGPTVTLSIILLAYIILGAVFDEISAMLITLPLVLPIVIHLGYDAVWWGIMNVIIIELGMIVPPIGIIVFILHGLAPQIPLSAIYRGVIPFIVADLILLALLLVFPVIATGLLHI